jgi:putative copper export protein
VVALVALTGAYNWRRLLPSLGQETGTRRLQRSARVEVAIAIVVLIITAILVATSPPAPMDG